MNNKCGLVSISFRNKNPDELIELCIKAGLKYIEWGSDVHCPITDLSFAEKLGQKTIDAGLIPYCYGSYFKLGITDNSEFEMYCKAAKALGAECIRIWAYNKQYSDCSDEEIYKIEESLKETFYIAKKYNLNINFEYHRKCLTEKIQGMLQLYNIIKDTNIRVHWQPNPEITVEENLEEMRLLPRIDIVHVFAWTYENGDNIRHPLYEHHLAWSKYITEAKKKNAGCIFELEFFKDDTAEQFYKDAETLLKMVK